MAVPASLAGAPAAAAAPAPAPAVLVGLVFAESKIFTVRTLSFQRSPDFSDDNDDGRDDDDDTFKSTILGGVMLGLGDAGSSASDLSTT